ncbi:MAG: quinate 5-dehydrogenase [Actinobacteria bacterium]|nr:MAG: quinate 5-dehydrogenase [Actinomycetota bacterium]
MKKVVGVSIGSAKRDHAIKVDLLGTKFDIKRVGTDGSLQKAKDLLKKLDGKVDAFGLGGIDLYFVADAKKYVIRDANKLKKAVKKTPIVDGSGLKHTLERHTIKYLIENNVLPLKEKTVLMVAAVDRFGMAEALHQAGCKIIFGDLIFGLGIPIPLRSYKSFRILAKMLLPVVTKLPFKVLYPTGSSQEKQSTKNQRYFNEADIIAGDFLIIRKYLPQSLEGKYIITNTTTAEDVKILKERGLKSLITTTPVFEGRSFGTNVMEATLVALMEKSPEQIKPQDYLEYIKKLNFKPRIEIFC